jgi:hypothetical protein
MNSHVVTVTINEGRVTVDKEQIKISQDDDLQWRASGKERFEIEFPTGSPFASTRLRHGEATARNRPTKAGRFKYTVIDESDSRVRLDPVIIIDPRPTH